MLLKQLQSSWAGVRAGIGSKGSRDREFENSGASAEASESKLATTRSRAICILGMHRSGTSVLARALTVLGVFLGDPQDLMPATEYNPLGYWERLDVWRLQDRLLAQFNRQWNSPGGLPAQWHLTDAVRPYRAELTQIVTEQFAQRPLWGWKDPRSCLLLPLWREVLNDLGIRLACVISVRSPLDVANSLKTRDGMPLADGLWMWFHHYIAAVKNAAGLPTIFLAYDQLLESWEAELRRCAVGLGLKAPAHGRWSVMRKFIRPVLRHHRSTLEDLHSAPAPVRELYVQLLNATGNQGGPDSGIYGAVEQLAQASGG